MRFPCGLWIFTEGNLRFPCGFTYVHMGILRFPCDFPYVYIGKPGFPLCFPLETWSFHVVFPYLPYGETTSWPKMEACKLGLGVFPLEVHHVEKGSFQDGNPMGISCKHVVSMWFPLCFPWRQIPLFTQCA